MADKIIDIELLSKMPITKEFAELLFGVLVEVEKIKIDFGSDYINYTYNDVIFSVDEDGSMEKGEGGTGAMDGYGYYDIASAFQIVRYIDNYLNSFK